MLYFVLGGLFVLTLIVLSQNWWWAWKLVGVTTVCVLTVFAIYVLAPNIHILGTPGELPWWLPDVVLFAVLILGMSAKYLWDLIEIRDTKNSKRLAGEPKVGLDFDFWDFVKPMLVSVIVFGAVTNMKHELTRIAVLGSFQNGFFWQTVFKKRVSDLDQSGSRRVRRQLISRQ